jgi:hypothetical protein
LGLLIIGFLVGFIKDNLTDTLSKPVQDAISKY